MSTYNVVITLFAVAFMEFTLLRYLAGFILKMIILHTQNIDPKRFVATNYDVLSSHLVIRMDVETSRFTLYDCIARRCLLFMLVPVNVILGKVFWVKQYTTTTNRY